MELTVTPHDGYVLARTKGPLDEHSRPQFREQLHPLVGKPGTRLVIDLGESLRINSPGIGHLVALVADANTNQSQVVLCNIQPFIAGVLQVTRLDRYFEIAPSVEDAFSRDRQ
jgi:anti-anti-sigma factor